MSTKNYDPNQVFIVCTLPNGNTANIMADLPNVLDAIVVKYKEPRAETISCLNGDTYNVFNASRIGLMEIKVLSDSDTKLTFNGLREAKATFSMLIRNKSQTGDLLAMTNIAVVDCGNQTYGAAGERIRTYKFTGKIEAMI